MIEFESVTYIEPLGSPYRKRIITKIHISPWVLKACLWVSGATVLGTAWVAFGIYAS